MRILVIIFFLLILGIPFAVSAAIDDLEIQKQKKVNILENSPDTLTPMQREKLRDEIQGIEVEQKKQEIQKEDNTQKNNNIQKPPLNVVADEPSPWWKDWEAWGVILAILGMIAGTVGYIISRKKGRVTTTYFKQIDSVYSTFKMKSYRLEAELYRLRDMVTEDFKEGKLDQSSFTLLEERIEKYLSEIREQILDEQFGGLPGNLKSKLSEMLNNGEITKTEYKKFHSLITDSTLNAKDKDALNKLVKEWSTKDTEQ